MKTGDRLLNIGRAVMALRAEGYTLADFAGREISLDGGIVRETLRGKVRIELP